MFKNGDLSLCDGPQQELSFRKVNFKILIRKFATAKDNEPESEPELAIKWHWFVCHLFLK